MKQSATSNKVRKVLLSPKLEGKAGREHLAGILSFLDAGHVWDVQIVRSASELNAETVRKALADGTEGFLLSVAAEGRQKTVLDLLARSCRPVVVLDDHGPGRRASNFAYVRFDTPAIVAAALDHFERIMPSAGVAFVPDPSHEPWSVSRENAFLSIVAKRRLQGSVFGGRTRRQLASWLAALPSPTGVLAANDASRRRDMCGTRHCSSRSALGPRHRQRRTPMRAHASADSDCRAELRGGWFSRRRNAAADDGRTQDTS